MADLVIQCSNDRIFPLQEIRAGKVLPGDGVVCNERAVAGQILRKSFKLDQHLFLGERGEFTAVRFFTGINRFDKASVVSLGVFYG